MIFDIEQESTIKVWKQERIIAFAEDFDNIKFYTDLEGSPADPIATYTTPSSRILYIDVTDYVRAHPDVGSLCFYDETNAQDYQIGVTVEGLINPAGVLIPEREDGDSVCKISAPSVMLAPFGGLQIAFEMWASVGQGYYFTTERIKEKPSDTEQDAARTITLANGTARVEFWHLSDFIYRAVDILPLSCERTYACVEWVSFSGKIRRHVFDISKATVETGDTVELANILNEWTEIKGRVDGFTLRLENLDRYDLWYYSDMITSSSVRVTIDGVTWYDVHVDESAYTLPESNAGKLSTLEIPVKFRKYDAVSL
jgi:hypothetical protein